MECSNTCFAFKRNFFDVSKVGGSMKQLMVSKTQSFKFILSFQG